MKNVKNISDEALLRFEQDFAIASAIVTVDGATPSKEDKRLFLLYKQGVIDLETAKNEIVRMHTKRMQ